MLQEYFQDPLINQIKSSTYQVFINHYAKRNVNDTIRRLNKEVQKEEKENDLVRQSLRLLKEYGEG